MGEQASLDFQKMQRGWMEQQYQYLYRGAKYYINDNFKITGTKPADTGGKMAEFKGEISTSGLSMNQVKILSQCMDPLRIIQHFLIEFIFIFHV